MFSIFRSNKFMSNAEKKRLVQSIKNIEMRTSGEVRVYIEGECPTENPMLRCKELFVHLDMHKTILRNAVLIYVATKDRKYAIFGDEGIYEKAGQDYWNTRAERLVAELKAGHLVQGINECLQDIGDSLATFYPPRLGNKNELPDDIVFGKF
jgi:uncharacterized membrane protein